MKWRIFITFQILCYLCIYPLWAYVIFAIGGATDDDPWPDASNHLVIILVILYSISIVKAVVDCVLYYYSFKIINTLVK